MTPGGWRYVAASVVGTSHEKLGGICQDANDCQVHLLPNGEKVFVAAVADGAGSALRGGDGDRHGQAQGGTDASRHAIRLDLAMTREKTCVHRDERCREDTFAEEILQQVGNPERGPQGVRDTGVPEVVGHRTLAQQAGQTREQDPGGDEERLASRGRLRRQGQRLFRRRGHEATALRAGRRPHTVCASNPVPEPGPRSLWIGLAPEPALVGLYHHVLALAPAKIGMRERDFAVRSIEHVQGDREGRSSGSKAGYSIAKPSSTCRTTLPTISNGESSLESTKTRTWEPRGGWTEVCISNAPLYEILARIPDPSSRPDE